MFSVSINNTMPKNKKGGSGHKKMANKNGEVKSKEMVISRDDDEMYSVIVKNYGNGRSEILCNDGVKRMMNIPKRFRGRNKWDNLVVPGTFVLVGIRSWEVRASSKMQKCDLLYVYDEEDVNRLRKSNVPINWKTLQSTNNSYGDIEDLGFEFTEDDEISFDFERI